MTYTSFEFGLCSPGTAESVGVLKYSAYQFDLISARSSTIVQLYSTRASSYSGTSGTEMKRSAGYLISRQVELSSSRQLEFGEDK